MPAGFGSHLLVPIGFDRASRNAKQFALELAMKASARLTLLHVSPAPSMCGTKSGLDSIEYLHQALIAPSGGAYGFSTWTPFRERLRQQMLNDLSRELHPDWKRAVDWQVDWRSGDVVEQVLQYAQEQQVDTIVIGRKKRRLLPSWRASLSERIARQSPCGVLMVWDACDPQPTLLSQWRQRVGAWRRKLRSIWRAEAAAENSLALVGDTELPADGTGG